MKNHYFFNLKDFREYLIKWTENNNLQPAIKNKLDEWLNDNLNDWDITRDSPYFGFKIPGESKKYFYVWLDAPIGYLASFLNFAEKNKIEYDSYFNSESEYELFHFIGKDIVYFHTLFWPAVLEGANIRKPTSVFAHGFLTINGKKMLLELLPIFIQLMMASEDDWGEVAFPVIE